MAHPGAWFGLPDFGVTEWVSDKLGRTRTADGGSNIFGSSQPIAQQPVQQSGQLGYTPWTPSWNYSANQPAETPRRSQASSSSVSNQSPSGFDVKNPNANPGDDWFYDAADGWKRKTSDASSEVAAREAQRRAGLESAWNEVFGSLDRIGQRLPGQRDEQIGQINNFYQTSADRLGSAKQHAGDKIHENQQATFNTIANDLQNMLRVADTRLGRYGSGSSSAAGMYEYALNNAATRHKTSAANEASRQLANLQYQYDDQMSQLNEQKNNRLFELGQWYHDAINKIDMARSNASGEKARALDALNEQLHIEALSRLRDIENQANNWQNTINAWKLEQSGRVNNAVSNLGNIPAALNYAGMNAGADYNNTGVGNNSLKYGGGYSPKEDEEAGTAPINLSSRYLNPIMNYRDLINRKGLN